MTERLAIICDQDSVVLDQLISVFSGLGLKVQIERDGRRALDAACSRLPDILVVDSAITVLGGSTICRAFRRYQKTGKTFVVAVSKNSAEQAELDAFESGADEFFRKPIRASVFKARIEALLRRDKEITRSPELEVSDLRLFPEECIVLKGAERISLTIREFSVLYQLALRPGRVLRREQLLDSVWSGLDVFERTIDVHIKRLRQKIPGEYIETVRGIGYRFVEQEKSANRLRANPTPRPVPRAGQGILGR